MFSEVCSVNPMLKNIKSNVFLSLTTLEIGSLKLPSELKTNKCAETYNVIQTQNFHLQKNINGRSVIYSTDARKK